MLVRDMGLRGRLLRGVRRRRGRIGMRGAHQVGPLLDAAHHVGSEVDDALLAVLVT